MDRKFWNDKSLHELSPHEWEQLCDGCGKCCMNKIEDEDSGEIFFTNVACQLFDEKSCRCLNYEKRRKFVPDCQQLTPKKVLRLKWLPSTCAYRLVANGEELPAWHHLISGKRSTIHKYGMSMRGRVIRESQTKNLEQHVVDWLS